MSKPDKALATESKCNESNYCEIIELASNDIDLLARAFDVINQVCCQQIEQAVDSAAEDLDVADFAITESYAEEKIVIN